MRLDLKTFALLLSAQATCAFAEDLSFQDVRIGASIAEVTAAQAGKDPINCPGYAALESNKAIGGQTCTQFGRGPFTSGTTMVQYDFAPGLGSDKPLLFALVAVFDGYNFENAEAALRSKWGKPAKIEVAKLKNGFGAEFSSQEITWALNTSTLRLREMCGSTKESCIELSDSKTDAAIARMRSTLAADAAKRF